MNVQMNIPEDNCTKNIWIRIRTNNCQNIFILTISMNECLNEYLYLYIYITFIMYKYYIYIICSRYVIKEPWFTHPCFRQTCFKFTIKLWQIYNRTFTIRIQRSNIHMQYTKIIYAFTNKGGIKFLAIILLVYSTII